MAQALIEGQIVMYVFFVFVVVAAVLPWVTDDPTHLRDSIATRLRVSFVSAGIMTFLMLWIHVGDAYTTHGYGDKVSCNYGYPNMLDTSVQRLIGSYECILNCRFAIALFFLSALVILMLERKILRYFITQRG